MTASSPLTVCTSGCMIVSDASARYPRTLLLLGGATLSTQSARGADWSRPVKAVARGRGFFSAQRDQDSFSSVVLGALELVPRAAGTGSTTSPLCAAQVFARRLHPFAPSDGPRNRRARDSRGQSAFSPRRFLINALWLAQRGSRTAKCDKLEHDATLAATWGFVLRARLQRGIP